jgi:hypothetical protein
MEEMLSAFQSHLGDISGEIQSLQDQVRACQPAADALPPSTTASRANPLLPLSTPTPRPVGGHERSAPKSPQGAGTAQLLGQQFGLGPRAHRQHRGCARGAPI